MIERYYSGFDGDGLVCWWAPMSERLTGRVHDCDNDDTSLEVEGEVEERYGFLWLSKRTVTKRSWVKRRDLRFCQEKIVADPIAFLRASQGKGEG